MSTQLANTTLDLPSLNALQLANLCGVFHENIKYLERFLGISIKIDANGIRVFSDCSDKVNQASLIFQALYSECSHPIDIQQIKALLNRPFKEDKRLMKHSIKLSRKTIQPRNKRQAEYLESIDSKDIIFAVGPAGTGKTYLAVSKAIECFERGEVQRLVFVRPAVEAGEKLGFLPGDLVEKVLPYLRPIYDALYEMIGFKETQKLIQSDVIEILPLAFMRGRTLNEAFIILDEAQNTTVGQMKMFLTRMGFGSKTVVAGDMTQVDLPKGTESGLSNAIKLLNSIEEISIHTFTSQEVVRHPLVSRIVDCYDKVQKDPKS